MDPDRVEKSEINKAFDETYFKRAVYADVTFKKYSQYWWSNRFYSGLAKRFGPKSGSVLEVGTGLGDLLGWFDPQKYRVTGTDINPWALEQARLHVPAGQFLEMDAEDLSRFADGSFQIVISKHVVEHLPNPRNSINEMCRILSPGGLLVLATPNLDSPMRSLKKEKWVGYRDPTHISLKTPAEWTAMIKENGLFIKKIFSDGFWDAPYYPLVPKMVQKIIFGGPGGLQAILGLTLLPVKSGESIVVLAVKG